MEGPSLLLAEEQVIVFKGKKVKLVSGNTMIAKERLLGKEVLDIFSWGKHLVFQFDTFAIRIHFLLFGTYEATVSGVSVTGDYQRSKEPRLFLEFDNGNIKLFNCSIKLLDEINARSTYDFSISIMSNQWDKSKAYEKLLALPSAEIADVLLDQDIFAGVGNIIKNEVLFLVKLSPKDSLQDIPTRKIKELISLAHSFSLQFYVWRKQFILRKNLIIYRKSYCPVCATKIIREKTGKTFRWSYYCPHCQPNMRD